MVRIGPVTPWPRVWYNYPIILCGICLQYVWAIVFYLAPEEKLSTIVSILGPEVAAIASPNLITSLLLSVTATFSILGFRVRRKITTMYLFLPQQFMMVLGSVGAIKAIWTGEFVNGVFMGRALMLANQAPIIFLTIFHTWAMILILIHANDRD